MSWCELNSHALWRIKQLTPHYICMVMMHCFTGICSMHCLPFSRITTFTGIYTVRCMPFFRLYMSDHITSNKSGSFHNWKNQVTVATVLLLCNCHRQLHHFASMLVVLLDNKFHTHLHYAMRAIFRMNRVTIWQITFTFIFKCKWYKVGRQCRVLGHFTFIISF